MADKYIIEGATYNGDGTTSAEAASAGAAGAWNHIDILTGTAVGYGTLAAGDTVYIRSKTSAGADITVTLTAAISLGFASATATSWVTWVLDGGTVWSGVQGVLKYTSASTWGTTFRDFNEFIGYAAEKLVIENTNANINGNTVVTFGESRCTELFLDFSTAAITSGNGTVISLSASNKNNTQTNLKIKVRKWENNLFNLGNSGYAHLINPDIEMLVAWAARIFNSGSQTRVDIDGGRLYGLTGSLLAMVGAGTGAYFQFNNFTYSKIIPWTTAFSNTTHAPMHVIGPDGIAGGFFGDSWGNMDSRDDGYYPYLDAVLPDSNSSGWSWKIYPQNTAIVRPLRARISKLYTDTAAAKTVTVEMQIAEHYTTLNRSTLWAIVNYIDDTTGASKSVSSKLLATTALTTSTAAWSASTWGAINLLKRKIELTTPTTIKQDTLIEVLLMGTAVAPDVNGVFFVDPGVQLS